MGERRMDYTKYYEAREKIVEIVSKDLLGPVTDDEIICKERPLDYYILGKLYPKNFGIREEVRSSAEDCGDMDDESGISLSNSKNPSSFGITFSLTKDSTEFQIISKVAVYTPIPREKAQEKLHFKEEEFSERTEFWQREEPPLDLITVQVNDLITSKVLEFMATDKLKIQVLLHKVYGDGSKTVTVSMINENEFLNDYSRDCINSFFQPKIEIIGDTDTAFRDVRRNVHLNENPEIAELELLYSRIGNFASGHGCAVNWELNESGFPRKLYTEFLPTFEVLQMMPSSFFKNKVLGMKYIAFEKKEKILSGLTDLVNHYSKWIADIEKNITDLSPMYQPAAKINIEKCKKTRDTLMKSVSVLKDDIVFKAFSLANRAMFYQRKQMLINTGKYTTDEDITWYPFQLAFFLQEVISFAEPNGEERKNVDLLWFPTGGGKTEAYLGIAAFVIFLRRLRKGNNGAGVTVLMRYTLRLLSYQQFERASALICACEVIRKEENILGGEIGIGLWAGKALTPNQLNVAQKILNGEKDPSCEESNPVQVKKCPWCGHEITSKNYFCDLEKKRMRISCPNPKCVFHKQLPVYLVDEEIYEHTPTFIVSTVDKFAQIALNYETTSLFGKNKNLLPPDLIIQDELHLISGPLGTITGLYEAAIRKLCENNGVFPKIVASTATIRNAKEQIKALYCSSFTQFPPQGIDINDSFFATLSTKEQKPAREYLGCMAIGTSPTTMMIRVMTSLLFATRYLTEQGYDEKVIDSFWTITGYFNALRELGGAVIRVVDDIQDRFNYLKTSKFKNIYLISNPRKRYDKYKELTSRVKTDDLANVIQKELKEEYKADGTTEPYDFLLSSNMISVGVDVGRLGSMVVVGQPKTTSEYIQATSRVGRETPGLVLTTYNQSKSRDRSHYEDFTQYHNTFYRYVEATSVTPFSDRARDRALQAVYVILCRNLIPELAPNDGAGNFSRTLPQLKEIRQYLADYVKMIDPEEYEHLLEDIDDIEAEWEKKTHIRLPGDKKLVYRINGYVRGEEELFDPDYEEDSRFRILNTMRSVETSMQAFTDGQ